MYNTVGPVNKITQITALSIISLPRSRGKRSLDILTCRCLHLDEARLAHFLSLSLSLPEKTSEFLDYTLLRRVLGQPQNMFRDTRAQVRKSFNLVQLKTDLWVSWWRTGQFSRGW